jgi:hypothetical protein
MRSLVLVCVTFAALVFASARADAVFINGSISGPTTLDAGATATFTLTYNIGGFQGADAYSDNSLVFEFGDGTTQNFTVSTGSHTRTFNHTYVSIGDFIPTVSGSIAGSDIKQSCTSLPFGGGTICIPTPTEFTLTPDISGDTLVVLDGGALASASAPAPVWLVLAGLGFLAARRVRRG